MSIRKILIGTLILTAGICLSSATSVLAQDLCNGDFTYDGDVDGKDVTEFLNHFGRNQYSNPCPPNGPAPVPITGLTNSYASGDDGDTQAGVNQPFPRYEFYPGSTAFVLDNFTGLVWSRFAGSSQLTWNDALQYCNNNSVPAGNPMRLPNVRELQSLLNYNYYAPALSDASGYYQWFEGDIFENVQSSPYPYWTSTVSRSDTNYAYTVSMFHGVTEGKLKAGTNGFVWCVYGGPPPTPTPIPRFTINGNGTVTDRTTGLIWLRDAFCPALNSQYGEYGPTWYEAVADTATLSNGDCGLTDGSIPGDWRVPTRGEYATLLCDEYFRPSLCNTNGDGQWQEGDPFTNVQCIETPPIGNPYWTSTDDYPSGTRAILYCPGDQWPPSGSTSKTSWSWRWPVRDP